MGRKPAVEKDIFDFSNNPFYKRLTLFGMAETLNTDYTIEIKNRLCDTVENSEKNSLVETNFDHIVAYSLISEYSCSRFSMLCHILDCDETFEEEIKYKFAKVIQKSANDARKTSDRAKRFSGGKLQVGNQEELALQFMLSSIKDADNKDDAVVFAISLALYESADIANRYYKYPLSKEKIKENFKLRYSSGFRLKYLTWLCEHFEKCYSDKDYLMQCHKISQDKLFEYRKQKILSIGVNLRGDMSLAAKKYYGIVDNEKDLKDEPYNDGMYTTIVYILEKYREIETRFVVASSEQCVRNGVKNAEAVTGHQASNLSKMCFMLRYVDNLIDYLYLVNHSRHSLGLMSHRVDDYDKLKSANDRLEKDVRRKTTKLEETRDELKKVKESQSKTKAKLESKSKKQEAVFAKEKELEKLRKEVDELRKKNNSLEYDATSKEKSMLKLQADLAKALKDNEEMQQQCDALTEALNEFENEVDGEDTTFKYEDYRDEILSMVGDRRIFVAGGTEGWRDKILSEFNKTLSRSVDSFRTGDICQGDVVILQIKQMKHRTSVPIINRCRELGLCYIITSQTNTDMVMQRLYSELKSEIDGSLGSHY